MPAGAFFEDFYANVGVDLPKVFVIAFLAMGTLFFSSVLTTLVTLTTLAWTTLATTLLALSVFFLSSLFLL